VPQLAQLRGFQLRVFEQKAPQLPRRVQQSRALDVHVFDVLDHLPAGKARVAPLVQTFDLLPSALPEVDVHEAPTPFVVAAGLD
jgi:hypothetical protein